MNPDMEVLRTLADLAAALVQPPENVIDQQPAGLAAVVVQHHSHTAGQHSTPGLTQQPRQQQADGGQPISIAAYRPPAAADASLLDPLEADGDAAAALQANLPAAAGGADGGSSSTPAPSRHEQKHDALDAAWSNQRGLILGALVTREAVTCHPCDVCGADSTVTRCLDCKVSRVTTLHLLYRNAAVTDTYCPAAFLQAGVACHMCHECDRQQHAYAHVHRRQSMQGDAYTVLSPCAFPKADGTLLERGKHPALLSTLHHRLGD